MLKQHAIEIDMPMAAVVGHESSAAAAIVVAVVAAAGRQLGLSRTTSYAGYDGRSPRSSGQRPLLLFLVLLAPTARGRRPAAADGGLRGGSREHCRRARRK